MILTLPSLITRSLKLSEASLAELEVVQNVYPRIPRVVTSPTSGLARNAKAPPAIRAAVPAAVIWAAERAAATPAASIPAAAARAAATLPNSVAELVAVAEVKYWTKPPAERTDCANPVRVRMAPAPAVWMAANAEAPRAAALNVTYAPVATISAGPSVLTAS